MSSKFSINSIATAHFRTLSNYRTGKTEISSVFINLIFPLIIAFVFTYFKLLIATGEFNVILTAFSVFAALLLNLMILLYSILNREKEKRNDEKNPKKLHF